MPDLVEKRLAFIADPAVGPTWPHDIAWLHHLARTAYAALKEIDGMSPICNCSDDTHACNVVRAALVEIRKAEGEDGHG